MTTFVLVHGAFHGGWCWRDVSDRLRRQGHTVYAPSLTGLGERVHLAAPEVGLETHVADIVNLLEWEDLSGTALVGHSYGGMVIGSVGDRMPDRINALIYVDAIIPEDGKSVLDFQDPERRQMITDSVGTGNGWQVPPISADFYGVDDEALARWVDDKCVPHPWATFTQAARLSGDGRRIPRHAYVRCTRTKLGYMEQFVRRAEADADWELVHIDTGHDCMVTEPEALSRILIDHA